MTGAGLLPRITRSSAFRAQYRRLYAGFLMLGIASSSAFPLVPLFLTNQLKVSEVDVGLFLSTRFIGPVVVIASGLLARRLRSRIPLICVGALWLAVGWMLLSLVRHFWQAMVIGFVFFALSGMLNSQFAAVLHDIARNTGERRAVSSMSTLRGGFVLGSAGGLLVGTYLISALGFRMSFVATSLLFVLSIVPIFRLKVRRSCEQEDGDDKRPVDEDARTKEKRGYGPIGLTIFAVGIALILSGDAMKSAYLPIYVVDDLHHSVTTFGQLTALGFVVEIAAFPIIGAIANRLGTSRIVWTALLAGVLEYSLLANSRDIGSLVVAQLLHPLLAVGVFGIGVSHIQERSRSGIEAANSAFFSAQGIATPLGGLIGSVGFSLLGIPALFWFPTIVCIACFTGFTIEAMRGR